MPSNIPEIAPVSYAAAPLVALVALVACIIIYQVRRVRAEHPVAPGAIAWPLPFAVLLCLAAFWCGNEMYSGDLTTLVIYSATLFAFGSLQLLRKPVLSWIEGRGLFAATWVRTLRDLVALIGASLLCALAIDLVWNTEAGLIPLQFFACSALLAFAALVALYLLGQRTGILCLIVPIAYAGFGIAQYFVLMFKGAAILPSDLLSLQTAAAVADSYEFQIGSSVLVAIALASAAAFLLSLVWPGLPRSPRNRAINVAANLVCGMAVCGVIFGFFSTYRLTDLLSYDYDHWMPINTYKQKGFVPSFIAMAQDLVIEPPAGYTDEATESQQAQLASTYDSSLGATPERAAATQQFEQTKPTVIAIMNESFSDLTAYEPVAATGYPGPTFFNSMADTLQRGTFMTSVVGGGTANTEFEFLTGNTTAFTGGKTMYQLYDFSDVDSLAKQLGSLGYETHAIHPQSGSNYNRSTVYTELGFETFHDIDEFTDVPMYHNWVSDRATYDKILEILADNDGPQFIFDVTMQNHGGYNTGGIPEQDITNYVPAGMTDANQITELNTYLSCVTAADRDLSYFIGELKKLNRPVVLVFFGDHQPSVSVNLNDTYYAGEDDLTHRMRLYHTSYFVWANYDVAGNDQISTDQTIGANALAAQMLHLIGAPLTEYQKALLTMRQTVPALSAAGYRTADGMPHNIGDPSDGASLVDTLERMQYLNLVEKIQ